MKKKSKIICKNVTPERERLIRNIMNCETVSKTKYLGIQVTPKNIDLFQNNFEILWNLVDKDMMNWNKLQLSLIGSISLVKMNLLPRLMFLMQNIPIIRNNKVFELWHKKSSRFIWAGKSPHIKLKTMMDNKNRGGLSLPNFQIYHEAICLSWAREWITQNNLKLLNLEGFNLNFGWHAYLIHDKHKADKFSMHHYIRKSIFAVWQKYIKKELTSKIPLWVLPWKEIMIGAVDGSIRHLTYQELTY